MNKMIERAKACGLVIKEHGEFVWLAETDSLDPLQAYTKATIADHESALKLQVLALRKALENIRVVNDSGDMDSCVLEDMLEQALTNSEEAGERIKAEIEAKVRSKTILEVCDSLVENKWLSNDGTVIRELRREAIKEGGV